MLIWSLKKTRLLCLAISEVTLILHLMTSFKGNCSATDTLVEGCLIQKWLRQETAQVLRPHRVLAVPFELCWNCFVPKQVSIYSTAALDPLQLARDNQRESCNSLGRSVSLARDCRHKFGLCYVWAGQRCTFSFVSLAISGAFWVFSEGWAKKNIRVKNSQWGHYEY